jgi:glycosyltransferase involved in cell wall biosynthesis
MKLSIIIPCYNEYLTISKIIKKINFFFSSNSKYKYEIIVIDDFSSDGTREILQKKLSNKISKLILNDKNYGKGYSVKKGIEVSSGKIILIQDADLEYDPNDYEKLIAPIINNFADVVIGSRFIGPNKKKDFYFYFHRLGNQFLTFLSNILSGLNLTDMENGYKVFRAELLKSIKLCEHRFGFEPEVIAKISKKNIRIIEVGVKYHGRKYSEGKKITWKDGLSAIRCIIFYNLFR